MINVGVIGLGMMGSTHLDAYAKLGDKCRVTALADRNPDKLRGKKKSAGNIDGQAQGGFDFATVPDDKKYDDGMALIGDPDVDMVDICLITPLHLEYAAAAVKADKHMLIEKPLARTRGDAVKLVELDAGTELIMMPAMCMRFWPEWVWLKNAVRQQTYGQVLGAQFRRVAQHPGGDFYSDGEQCGGALLDLHIHDTDFIHYLFGTPNAVSSHGYTKATGEPDHVVTQYQYDDIPLVVAEGGWAMAPGFGFAMQYTVNFENATASFDINASPTLTLSREGQREPIELENTQGYLPEIEYMLDCVAANKPPKTVTIASAAEAVRICEAEKQSIVNGRPVTL